MLTGRGDMTTGQGPFVILGFIIVTHNTRTE
jgi:hypothetical protein